MEELARIYGTSLFDVARKEGKLDVVREQLGQFADAVAADRTFQVFLFSPYFSTEEKKNGLERALTGTDPVLMRFLELLVEKHRMPVLFRIREEYNSLCEQAEQRLAVEITSAVELDERTADGVAEQIGKHTGRHIELRRRVDPEIIGGLIVRVGNSILDASIRTRLESLRREVARPA
jgi:F-type H+-transporting ATPase subunit delta